MQDQSFYRYVSAILKFPDIIHKREVLYQFETMLREEKDSDHLPKQLEKIELLKRYEQLSLLLFKDIPDKMVTESYFQDLADLGKEGDEKARQEYDQRMEMGH